MKLSTASSYAGQDSVNATAGVCAGYRDIRVKIRSTTQRVIQYCKSLDNLGFVHDVEKRTNPQFLKPGS